MEEKLGLRSTTAGFKKEYPKRLFKDGDEPQVRQINNTCRMSILTKIKDALPIEYETVKCDPLFAHVFAIHENGLGYSARLIHSIMCRQLVTKKKHELWFVFGRKPLRFSMQEFDAVTGLKYNDDFSCNLDSWKDDNGFWSKLLKREKDICIKSLMDVHLLEAHKWKSEDKIRFVYVCVIAGLVMAKDEKKKIPLSYIQLVMDLDKLRAYPWGFHAFDHLVNSIMETRRDLKKTNSYILNGFSYALQIWVMEAIPVIGELLGEKINKELVDSPRCSNWKAAAKVSYQDIIFIEQSIGPKDIVFPYISNTGNNDVVESAEFLRRDEINDKVLRNLNVLIRSGYDFGDFVWGCVETHDVDEEKIKEVIDEDDYVESKVDDSGELTEKEIIRAERNVGFISSRLREIQMQNYLRKKELKAQREKDLREGLQFSKNGKYEEALERFESVLVASYNVACCYSKLNQVQAGLSALEEALKSGYEDFKRIRTDPDLENVRKSKDFDPLLKQFDESFINESAINAIKSLFGFNKK